MRVPVGRVVWGVLLAVGGAVEAYGVANVAQDDTLSEFTRWAFAVDTEPGRWIFGLAWCGFAGWFLVHIIGGRSGRLKSSVAGLSAHADGLAGAARAAARPATD